MHFTAPIPAKNSFNPGNNYPMQPSPAKPPESANLQNPKPQNKNAGPQHDPILSPNTPYIPFGKKAFDGENTPSSVSNPTPDAPSSATYPTMPSDTTTPSYIQNPQIQNSNLPSWTQNNGSTQPSWTQNNGSIMPSWRQSGPSNQGAPKVTFGEALKAYVKIRYI